MESKDHNQLDTDGPTSGTDLEPSEVNPADSGSWWGSWNNIVSTVKNTSEKVYNIYKEDLSEFSSTITEDTKNVVEEKILSPIRENKSSNQSFGTQVVNIAEAVGTSLLGLEKDQFAENQILSQKESALLSLQKDENTYKTDPEEEEALHRYKTWYEDFDLKLKTDEISQLLTENEVIRNFHSKLVPVEISYADFWKRYYFRVLELTAEDEKRAELLRRADQAISQADQEDDDLLWDEISSDDEPEDTQQVLEEIEAAFKQVVSAQEVQTKTEDAENTELQENQKENQKENSSPSPVEKLEKGPEEGGTASVPASGETDGNEVNQDDKDKDQEDDDEDDDDDWGTWE